MGELFNIVINNLYIMRLYKKKHVIVVFPDRLSYVNVERGEWVNVLLQSAAKNWCVFWLPIISQVCRYVLVLESPHISTVRKYLPHCSHLIKEKMSDNSIQNGIFVN